MSGGDRGTCACKCALCGDVKCPSCHSAPDRASVGADDGPRPNSPNTDAVRTATPGADDGPDTTGAGVLSFGIGPACPHPGCPYPVHEWKHHGVSAPSCATADTDLVAALADLAALRDTVSRACDEADTLFVYSTRDIGDAYDADAVKEIVADLRPPLAPPPSPGGTPRHWMRETP